VHLVDFFEIRGWKTAGMAEDWARNLSSHIFFGFQGFYPMILNPQPDTMTIEPW